MNDSRRDRRIPFERDFAVAPSLGTIPTLRRAAWRSADDVDHRQPTQGYRLTRPPTTRACHRRHRKLDVRRHRASAMPRGPPAQRCATITARAHRFGSPRSSVVAHHVNGDRGSRDQPASRFAPRACLYRRRDPLAPTTSPGSPPAAMLAVPIARTPERRPPIPLDRRRHWR